MSPQVSRTRRVDATFDANRRAETLGWLEVAGCPACRLRDRETTRWLDSFAGEHHADLEVIAALRASRGFCPAHTRRLLANTSASWLLGTVYGDVLPAAAAELATRPGSAPAPCPACLAADGAAERVFSQLRSDLVDTSVRAAYEAHGGLCLPDAFSLCAAASAPAAGFVLAVARRGLDAENPLEVLAGDDGDAVHRDRLRSSERNRVVERYRGGVGQRRPRERLVALLGDEACPVCASAARQLFEHLDWLVSVPAADARAEELLLCAAHLHDVRAADSEAGRRAAVATAEALRGRLDRLVERLGARSGDWSKPDRTTAEAVVAVAALSVCRVCASIEQGVRRGSEMLVAMLGDPAVGAAFSSSHGVCVRHAHGWSDLATAPQIRQTATLRLAELGFDLAEAQQKSVWWNRYETRGAEATAWQGAPEILDSWVYLGIGAPV
jgi:hypothetical protein